MEEQKREKWLPLILLLIGISLVWFLLFVLIFGELKCYSDQNSFGNSSNAISALFSGLAFGALIYTVYLQRTELKLQRKELEQTRVELKRAADAQEKSEVSLQKQIDSMNITAKLNALNSLLDYYSNEETIWKSRNKEKYIAALKNKEKYVEDIEYLLTYIKGKA